MIKDLALALAEAERQDIDLQAARGAIQRYQALSEQGDGELGTQALALHESLHGRRSDSYERK
jgi:3-hydroxyisobutyrate dehydrogenase-like beta-hydroxyacid dehydrogenase